MDQEIKQKWVDALRSGTYKQMKGRLYNINEDPQVTKELCCLGVFDRVILGEVYINQDSPYVPRDEYIPRKAQYDLANFNDSENSDFNQIADYIEENL